MVLKKTNLIIKKKNLTIILVLLLILIITLIFIKPKNSYDESNLQNIPDEILKLDKEQQLSFKNRNTKNRNTKLDNNKIISMYQFNL